MLPVASKELSGTHTAQVGLIQNRVASDLEAWARRNERKSRCIKHLMDCIALRAHTTSFLGPLAPRL
jgi:hypothetical protein